MSVVISKPVVEDLRTVIEENKSPVPLNALKPEESRRGSGVFFSQGLYKSRLKNCGQKYVLMECSECEIEYVVRLSCGLRTCPECAKKRALVLYLQVIKIVLGLKIDRCYRLRHIVLTWGIEGSLEDRVQKIWKAFIKLWRNYLKPLGSGAVVCLEIGEERGSVHLHILFYGLYVDVENLRKRWFGLTGKHQVWVKEVKGRGGVREVLKYAVKGVGGEIYKTYEIEKALNGVRRVRRYGVFLGSGRGVYFGFECPFCGSKKWSYKGVLDCEFDRQEILTVMFQFGVFARASPSF